MSDTQKHSEETIFSKALEYSGAEREAFLDRMCAGDPELRQRIAKLLRSQPLLGEFMEQEPAVGGRGLGPSTLEDLSADLSAGEQLGRYKILQRIGEGGCGIVYMAEQLQPVQRRVALKILKLGMDTKAVLARFEAERQALALMEHPNIAKVFDADTSATGRPYFVMELVRGTRITEFCNQHQLSTNERLELALQVCHAIQHAHQKGIIHRDLKPSNILVTVDAPGLKGSVKIIDFGIAKAVQGRLTDQTLFTAFDQVLGTPAYMSPEQTLLTTMDVDTRSDIYSLGVLLYELLTGTTPFSTKDLLKAGIDGMRRALQEEVPPLPSTRLSTLLEADDVDAAQFHKKDSPRLIHLVRGDLDWIVMKCLEKDRNRRYATASALAMDLERHLKDEPIEARRPSRLYRFQKSVRRHTWAYTLATVAVLSLAVGTAASLWQARRAKRAEMNQRRLAYQADMNLAQSALTAGDLGQARLLLKRYSTPYPLPDYRNWEWRYLAAQSQGNELYSLEGHDGMIGAVRFLDGDTVLSTGIQDFTTKIWDLQQRRLMATITNTNHGGGILLIEVDKQTQRAYYKASWRQSPHLFLLDLKTGKDAHFARMEAAIADLAFEPIRRRLAVAYGNSVRVFDLNAPDAAPKILTTVGQASAIAFSPVSPTLAILSQNGSVLLHDLDSGQQQVIPAPKPTIDRLDNPRSIEAQWWCRFAPDGKSMVLGDSSRLVQKCDLVKTTMETAFIDTERVVSASYSSDGHWLATVGDDAFVRLRRTDSWSSGPVLRGHTDPVVGVHFAPEGTRMVSGSRNGEIKVWSVGQQQAGPSSTQFPAAQKSGVLADGSAFWRVVDIQLSARTNGLVMRIPEVEIWSADTLKQLGSIPFGNLWLEPQPSQGFSALGKLMCIGGTDGRIHLRSMGMTEDVARTPNPEKNMNRAALSPDGSLLVTLRYYDWRLQVWRVPEMRLLAERADITDIHEMLISNDGKLLAIFTGRGELGTLRLPTLDGDKPRKVAGRATRWTAMAFSLDNKYLATALNTGRATLWNLETQQGIEIPRSPTEYASLSFSGDGSRLAASDVASVSLYDVLSGQRVLEIKLADALVGFTRPKDDLLAVTPQQAVLYSSPSLDTLRVGWLGSSEETPQPGPKRYE